MNELREVTIEEAEKIWAGKCPVCGGKLLAGPRAGYMPGDPKSYKWSSVNVMCEYGCKKFNVPPRPILPQRI